MPPIIAEGRGLRAARLQAIKRYVADNLGHEGLTVGAVAARHRVACPLRAAHCLRARVRRSSDYVLEQRLARVHRMLTSSHFARWTISAIALEAGFGESPISTAASSRRYGVRPSDVRAKSLS